MNRFDPGRLSAVLIPLGAGLVALLIGAVILLLLGANPIDAYASMVSGSFGSLNAFADTLVKAGPLLFVGIGTCIAFRCGVINIGGEGQIVMGGICATLVALSFKDLPGLVLLPLGLLAGFLGGATWAAIAGVLKIKFRVNEVLSTIMLNSIAGLIMTFLLTGTLMDPSSADASIRIPQTERMPLAVDLLRWVPTRMHIGVLLAVVMAILVYVLLWRT
ncbi:MAG TPA: ABC transporter permease, partial [Anaerolineae bacterium]